MRSATDAAIRLLSVSLAIGLLTACSQQPVAAPPAKTAKSEIEEVDALIAAMKQHPSLVNAAKSAGPPIHVDPRPASDGMPHRRSK